MLDSIISYSIKNKLMIGLFTIALILWGVYSVTKLPIDAVPDITNNQVQIITSAPSQSATDIERLVTFPIEQAVATIPDLVEVRSFSRFGLSVITVVFHDNVDVYKARQQVTERINTVKEQIPPDIGQPGLAPVTTGLGEIYQYVVHAKPGFEKKYSAMELRSIQDWIVRRQLLGVEGVADVSSFGGFLKQYEIALNPDRLQSMGISISEVFDALKKNNQNTGGAYIDKSPNSWYIRSEGLIGSLEDINNVVVKTNANGIPVLIRDLATVQFGHAVRYGAMTRNADGEVTGAIVMMLKGANSSEVIKNVKERISQIEKNLPEGVSIEPFLDRTKLVNNAIGTVTKNLAEGALIVIFVLVLLLGNLRAGLIVASVIPLAMLFAVSMMNLFGVSGNLMSLGAIDFGLIVDGAVIIVEATLHHLSLRKYSRKLTSSEMDTEVYVSASKIRNSAAFGEIIILIVYLPILALVGIEGKMFKPMAQTVSFAIIGAFILSLTYVPMASALFLNRNISTKRTISDRIMEKLQAIYSPLLHSVLKRSKLVIWTAIAFFLGALFLFNSMGSEFLPQLDEGDFAVETRVLTGSSLTTTVDATLKAAEILKRDFPDEIKEIVGKVGSGEIPTDPMPIEAADMMIILNDRDQWVKADNREDLADQMAESLEAIPGVSFGFQQPIQMRFNELISGAKQDVVVKIYGEDLDKLSTYAKKVAEQVSTVEGAKDLYVEQVTGLPQIVINFNRPQIARYGMDIQDINQAINTAFAGQSAGIVYEGEKRFDLVVRLAKDNRQQIEDVRNLYVPTKDGRQVPLTQVAEVDFKIGPNQIQRDDAKRRILVGFNVRDRDVKSIVTELQSKLNQRVKLEPGYFVSYGGSFQNLEEANNRLLIAVPVALLLIFLLLYFTFKSVRLSLLIYSAIPLSAIGGIVALWLRDMPFSISAGIGFIALFGVAVLNGIVLISQFNHLKTNGMADASEIIKVGTADRLRPVIMTALVASLGFLPMALSMGSGAEVQKPLATVVIGGLVSATLLTLFILPCLYLRFGSSRKRKTSVVAPVITVVFLGLAISGTAQYNLEKCITVAKQNNAQIKSAGYNLQREESLKKTSLDLGKTDLSYTGGQYNSLYRDNNISVTQTIEFPTTLIAKGNYQQAKTQQAEIALQLTEKEITREVSSAYFNLVFAYRRIQLYDQLDSLYRGFNQIAATKFSSGESSNLEKLAAEGKLYELTFKKSELQLDITTFQQQLQQLLGIPETIVIDTNLVANMPMASLQQIALENSLSIQYYNQSVKVFQKETAIEKNRLLPDLRFGLFSQTLTGTQNINGVDRYFDKNYRFTGFTLGLSIPLWFRPQVGRIQSARYQALAAESDLQGAKSLFQAKLNELQSQYKQANQVLQTLQKQGLAYAALQLETTRKAYQAGEIGYTEFLQGVSVAFSLQEQHLLAQNRLNQIAIQLQFISNQN